MLKLIIIDANNFEVISPVNIFFAPLYLSYRMKESKKCARNVVIKISGLDTLKFFHKWF